MGWRMVTPHLPSASLPALLTEQMPEVAARGPATSLGAHGKIYCSDPLICSLLLAKNHRLFRTSPPRLASRAQDLSLLTALVFSFSPQLPLLHPAPPNEPSASSLLLFKSEPSRPASEKQMSRNKPSRSATQTHGQAGPESLFPGEAPPPVTSPSLQQSQQRAKRRVCQMPLSKSFSRKRPDRQSVSLPQKPSKKALS